VTRGSVPSARAIMLAAGLIGSACGKNSERLIGHCRPGERHDDNSTSAPSPAELGIDTSPMSRTPTTRRKIHQRTSVTLDVAAGWDETSSSAGGLPDSARTMLFRLDSAGRPTDSAIGNWQAVERISTTPRSVQKDRPAQRRLPKWRPRLRGLGFSFCGSGVTPARHPTAGSSSTRPGLSRSRVRPRGQFPE